MNKQEFFSRRLLWVTGKGGVGKTTVSLALSFLAAEMGKKVLLVEVTPVSRVAKFLGIPEITYQERQILPGIFALNINPDLAVEEYMKLQLKFRFIYNRVLKNKLFRIFATALPGLDDLTTAGKIWYMEQMREKNGVPLFDIVVVDAPATGHCINLLNIPRATIDAVKFGPIKTQTQPIYDLFTDPERTLVNIVTLPEEMPTSETIEFAERIRGMSMPIGLVFINGIYPQPFSEKEYKKNEESLSEAGEDVIARIIRIIQEKSDLHRKYLEVLEKSFTSGIVKLPFIFSPDFTREQVMEIAQKIGVELSVG